MYHRLFQRGRVPTWPRPSFDSNSRRVRLADGVAFLKPLPAYMFWRQNSRLRRKSNSSSGRCRMPYSRTNTRSRAVGRVAAKEEMAVPRSPLAWFSIVDRCYFLRASSMKLSQLSSCSNIGSEELRVAPQSDGPCQEVAQRQREESTSDTGGPQLIFAEQRRHPATVQPPSGR